jgi:hypothetical protein
MGLGSFGFLRIWVPADLRREDGELGKRLGKWENIVVIGMIEDRQILEQSRLFCGERGRRENSTRLSYLIVSYMT